MNRDGLRVGLLGPAPPPNGGMAMQTRQLARLLAAEGVDVTFLATNAPYRPAIAGRLPVVRAIFRLVTYCVAIWRLAPKVDVIHLMANSGWSWHLFAAPPLWVAVARGTPVIVNYRGGEAREFFRRSFRWVRPTLARAAAVVVPSGYLRQVFREFDQDVAEIPNIVDTTVFSPGDTPRSPGFRLVITRNLERIYGIETALRAVAVACESLPSLELCIAGSGPDEARLRQLARHLGIEARVSFLGRLQREDVVALYRGADAMLNPSTVDNMPNSVIEALGCGVPVISSEVGGVPYIVEDGKSALLVPVGDHEAMAAAIGRLFSEEGLRERLVAAGSEAIQAYRWPEVRGLWLGLYRTLAERVA